MRNDLGVAIILAASVATFGGVLVLCRPSAAASTAAPLAYEEPKPVYTIVPAMDLPPVKRVVAEEPAPPAIPPAFSTQTPVARLMASPEARAVVLQDLPALANVSAGQIDMVGSMSLRTIQSMLPAILTDAALKKLDQDLAKVPAPAAPSPAPAAPVVAAATLPSTEPAPPAQTAAFSSRSTLASLLADPGARAVLSRELPALAQASQAQLNLAANMSLRDIQRLMPDAITDAALQRVDQGLDALKAPSPAAAPEA